MMIETLIDFLLELNEKGLINNHDFDYEKVSKDFVNKNENKELKELIKYAIGEIEPIYISDDCAKSILDDFNKENQYDEI